MDKVTVTETDGEAEEPDRRVSRNGKLTGPVNVLQCWIGKIENQQREGTKCSPPFADFLVPTYTLGSFCVPLRVITVALRVSW